jgi:hypothetical protein
MKHHINIILLAIRVMIICISVMALYNFLNAYVSAAYTDEAVSLISKKFTPFTAQVKPTVLDIAPLPYYFVCYALLLCYLVYVLVQLNRSFNRLEKGNIFYEKQATEFKRAGAGLIIFAKCNYLIYCGFGALCFRSLQSFMTEIPQFLLIYLAGKLVLVLYYLAEKGTFLKEEAELTI